MRSLSLLAASLAATATAAKVDLPISARTDDVDSDTTAVFYNTTNPVLIGNDGGASTGGFRLYSLDGSTPLTETKHETPGRTKLVTNVYDVGGKDLVVTIAQPDSFFRLYDSITGEQVGEPLTRTLGDWSALCTWKSQASGEQYVYLFGKKQAVHFLLREQDSSYEFVEIQTFNTSTEASSCAVSLSAQAVYFATDDDTTVYTFPAAEGTAVPEITVLGQAGDSVTGLAAYIGQTSDYLLVSQDHAIEVYDTSFALLGSATLTGDDDIEIKGLGLYQATTQNYPAGAVTYAIESDGGNGFAVSSLEPVFDGLDLESNTAFDPRQKSNTSITTVCSQCSLSGFCQNDGGDESTVTCACFAGFDGADCAAFTCRNDCSGHGQCVGANSCQCDDGWGGLYCAFKVVLPVAETDANGADGDDPAIWISPVDKSESRIITTTKSEEGAGLGVFDLSGKQLQTIAASEPNNVDVIYNFQAGNRTVDLTYAACREDNTMW